MANDEVMQEFGVTDEQLDEEAREYESGAWSGKTGNVVMGSPEQFDEEMETVSFRLPASRIRAVEAVVRRTGQSKSGFFRNAIDEALMRA